MPTTTRFFRRGKSKLYFCPAVANPTAGPTSAELTAGTDLSPQMQAIAGFNFSNTPIASPDLSTTFTSQINGEDTAAQSSLTFYDDSAGASSIKTALPKGTAGFVILAPYGNVSTKRAEVWPIVVASNTDNWSLGNEAAMFTAQFSITAPPTQNAAMP